MDSYSWRGVMLAACAVSGAVSSFVCFSQACFAQSAIAPDSTLPVNTVVHFNNNTYTITGGTQVGTNQFHSFQDFSVPTANTAHFDNVLTTANVIGRVTGHNISDIDGTLRTNGATNLYLINPNGIIFGANAKLDIAGSFSASTANSIKFSDGSEFSATNPQAPPLLQVNVPLGLQYNTPTPKPVSNAGNLTVGGDLTLSGSSVTITGTLNALQGNLQLDAVAGNVNVSQFQAGSATLTATQGVLLENGRFQTTGDLRLLAKDTVVLQDSAAKPLNLQVDGDLLVQGDRAVTVNTLAHSDSSLWVGNNVLLRSDNPIAIDAHWNAGGNLRIEKLNGSLGDLFSPLDPVFQFSGDVSFDNYTGGSLQILAGGSVTATGTIFINAGAGADFNNSTVILSDDSPLTIDGSTPFAVDIRAGVTTFFPSPVISDSSPTPISNFSTSTANPTSANISIGSILFDDNVTGANGLVFLTNQVAPNNVLAGNISVGEINTASTLGSAGSVVIDSKGNINLLTPIYAYSENVNGGEVNLLANKDITVAGIYTISNSINYSIGGNISLLSRNGNIDTTQGNIFAYSYNYDSGKVTLKAGQDVKLGNVYTASGYYGAANDIEINARSVSISNSFLSSSAYGYGNAGNITIKSVEQVSLSESRIYSRVEDYAIGNAGNINIDAKSVSINSSTLSSDTYGIGNSGNIFIKATDSALFNESLTSSNVEFQAIGNGGSINIDAKSVFTNGSEIRSDTYGRGNAGNISIKATDSVYFANTFGYSGVRWEAIGNAGNITIDAKSVLADDTVLASTTYGQGNAGNILIKATDSIWLDNSEVSSQSSKLGLHAEAIGNAGDVTLSAKSISLTGSGVLSNTNAQGNAGNVTVSADDSISFLFSRISSNVLNAVGDAGNITIDAKSVSLTGSEVESNTYGQGNAGSIFIKASDSILFSNSSAFSAVGLFVTGKNAGNITLDAKSISFAENSTLKSNTYGEGNAGNISLRASDSISFVNSSVITNVDLGAIGKAGNINLDAQSVSFSDYANLLSNTNGHGNAGSITIKSTNSVIFSNNSVASSSVLFNGNGNAGNLTVDAKSISLLDSSMFSSSTDGQGNAANITLTTTDFVSLINNSLIVNEVGNEALGNAGKLTITAKLVHITDNSALSSSTNGRGNAGSVTIKATDSISLIDNALVFSSVGTDAIGNAGNVTIDTNFLSLKDHSWLSSDTFGLGNAGNINVNAITSVIFANNSGASVSVGVNAVGDAGNINIDTKSALFANKSMLASGLLGTGNAGNIIIKANDSVVFDYYSGASSSVENNGALGNGGTISIDTNSLSLTNMSQLLTYTDGRGNAGDVKIIARNSVLLSGTGADFFRSAIVASTKSEYGDGGSISITTSSMNMLDGAMIDSSTFSSKLGGSIEITAQSLDLSNGSQIGSSTFSSGNAGVITIQLGRSLVLDGINTMITTSTDANSSGNGGSVFIDPPLVSITNGAEISVNSLGTGTGGNLQIIAGKFIFANNALLNANTASGEGGNINLQIADIFFPRNHSQITATAGNNGNGGNINLSALFLISIPSENNDIYANAFFGKGGNISISTQAIFGFQFRPRLTPLSDITASSEFGIQGNVNLNTLGIDPSKGLSNLPVDVSDPSRLVTQRCIADQRGSEFIITGKGGVPAKPSDRPTDMGVLDNFGTLGDRSQTAYTPSSNDPQQSSPPDAIVEATGWIVNAQNQVVLVAGKTPTHPTIRCPQ